MTGREQRQPRRARGRRPQFFDDPGIDQLYAVMLEMAAELSAARDRIDTLERLLDQQGILGRERIEGFEPDAEVEAERALRREDYLQRLFRVFAAEHEDADPTGTGMPAGETGPD